MATEPISGPRAGARWCRPTTREARTARVVEQPPGGFTGDDGDPDGRQPHAGAREVGERVGEHQLGLACRLPSHRLRPPPRLPTGLPQPSAGNAVGGDHLQHLAPRAEASRSAHVGAVRESGGPSTPTTTGGVPWSRSSHMSTAGLLQRRPP